MTTRSTLTLRGDRNQCPGCGEHFNSSYAFDKHRVGDHGMKDGPNARRCLTVAEMESKGWAKSDGHFWMTPARAAPGRFSGASPGPEDSSEPR
jgi:hypothetical protein